MVDSASNPNKYLILGALTPIKWITAISKLSEPEIAQVLIYMDPSDIDDSLGYIEENKWKDSLEYMTIDQVHNLYNKSKKIHKFLADRRDHMLQLPDDERLEMIRKPKHKYMFIDMSPLNMIHLIHAMTPEEKKDVIMLLPDEKKIHVMDYMGANERLSILNHIHGHAKDHILNIMPIKMLMATLNHMSVSDMQHLINRMTPDKKAEVVKELCKIDPL
jgi:Mg/Co/Ni transporter MgtE